MISSELISNGFSMGFFSRGITFAVMNADGTLTDVMEPLMIAVIKVRRIWYWCLAKSSAIGGWCKSSRQVKKCKIFSKNELKNDKVKIY